MKLEKWVHFTMKKDFFAAILSLLAMWIAYYLSQNVIGENEIASFFVAILFTMIGLCVVLPVWWVTHIDKVGIRGLKIRKEKLMISLILSVLLAIWRSFEIHVSVFETNAILTILFNLLAIWEVIFIFGWLFTRYEKCFGKIPAIILSSISVGIYHIGSLAINDILHLCLVIIVCGMFYSFVENLFMLWPIYWAIGCSASTLRSGMQFPKELVVMSAFILIIQITIIVVMECRFRKRQKKSEVLA